MNSLKKATQKGFTIVELLIVIVVIGILAGLVITTYNGIQQNARNKERVTDIKALKGQLEAYYAKAGYYPTSGLQASATTGLGAVSADNITFINAEMKGLDDEALRDPTDTNATFELGTTATANLYAYVATPAGCTAGLCTGYTLSYFEEGAGTNPQNESSLN